VWGWRFGGKNGTKRGLPAFKGGTKTRQKALFLKAKKGEKRNSKKKGQGKPTDKIKKSDG